jgi:hypothetical protein
MLLRFDIGKVAIRRAPEPRLVPSKRFSAGAYGTWEDDSGYWIKAGIGSDRAARNVFEFCRLYPDEVADLLIQYGINVGELYESAPYLD